jgi:hypothetical protein
MFISANAVREATLDKFDGNIKSTIEVLYGIIPEQIKEAQLSGKFYIYAAFTECDNFDTFANLIPASGNKCYVRTDMDKYTQDEVMSELKSTLEAVGYDVDVDEGYIGGSYHTCFCIDWH